VIGGISLIWDVLRKEKKKILKIFDEFFSLTETFIFIFQSILNQLKTCKKNRMIIVTFEKSSEIKLSCFTKLEQRFSF